MGYWINFETTDLDMMATIMAESGCIPHTYQENLDGPVICRIKVGSDEIDLKNRYEAGEIEEFESTFAECRSRLNRIVDDCISRGGCLR